MITNERELILEEEWLIVRDSGEIPEVALHSSLDYLCHDSDGPGLLLTTEELLGLYTAVQERYVEIILRDLTPSNRTLSLYRGVARAITNWQRLVSFCNRMQLDHTPFIEQISEAVLNLISVECAEKECGKKGVSGFNCKADELYNFLVLLKVPSHLLPEGWDQLCQDLI